MPEKSKTLFYDYNVAPTQEIPAILMHKDTRHIEKRHWGMVPFWAKDASIGARMINARVETITSKPVFRAALKQRRCSIPANGFYEWQGKAGTKQPCFFHSISGEPLAFAGLYEIWEDKEAPPGACPYKSCTIISTDASDSVKDVHDRMPLILKPEAYDAWLDPEIKEPGRTEEILMKGFVEELRCYPVSKLVNQVGNNKKECMQPLKDVKK